MGGVPIKVLSDGFPNPRSEQTRQTALLGIGTKRIRDQRPIIVILPEQNAAHSHQGKELSVRLGLPDAATRAVPNRAGMGIRKLVFCNQAESLLARCSEQGRMRIVCRYLPSIDYEAFACSTGLLA
jgi:hypothetical protein